MEFLRLRPTGIYSPQKGYELLAMPVRDISTASNTADVLSN
jgi:hypothetical protein